MVVTCDMQECPHNEYHLKQCRIHPHIKRQLTGFRGRAIAICYSYKQRVMNDK